jgi:nicotinamidase-related amidase
MKNKNILTSQNTLLLVIDVQKKLLPTITGKEIVEQNISRLIRGCKIHNVPIIYTEEYPKGLGETTDLIKKELEGLTPIEKLEFSCFQNEEFVNEIKKYKNLENIIVCGIESHVCVLQTCLDGLEDEFGYRMHCVADAVSSRKSYDYKYALDKMKMCGVLPTTVEIALFELTRISKTAEFKEISNIAKEFTDTGKKVGFQFPQSEK